MLSAATNAASALQSSIMETLSSRQNSDNEGIRSRELVEQRSRLQRPSTHSTSGFQGEFENQSPTTSIDNATYYECTTQNDRFPLNTTQATGEGRSNVSENPISSWQEKSPTTALNTSFATAPNLSRSPTSLTIDLFNLKEGSYDTPGTPTVSDTATATNGNSNGIGDHYGEWPDGNSNGRNPELKDPLNATNINSESTSDKNAIPKHDRIQELNSQRSKSGSSTKNKKLQKKTTNLNTPTDNSNEIPDSPMSIPGHSPANPKRNKEFHTLFRSVPENDCLIDDYSCALQKEILVQGRLYISVNHVCFNANIFGWVTNLVIAIADIASIEKRMTAFVLPNAVLISTLVSKHFFASFLARDTVYDLLTKLWRHSRPNLTLTPSFAESEYPDNQDYLESESATDVVSSGDDDNDNDNDNDNENAEASESSEEHPEAVPIRPRTPSKPQKINTHITGRRASPTVCACLKNKEHYSNVALDTKFTGSVEKIYNLLFTSGFVRKFLTDQEKCTDVNIGEWVSEPTGLLTRTSSYIKPLNNAIGPKSTKCYLKDECLHRDFSSYVTNSTTTTTPDVPSGGNFSVKTRTCIMWGGPNETRVIVTCSVEFTKSSWLKVPIERACIDGQQQYQKNLSHAIRKYIVAHPTEFQDEVGSPIRELSEITLGSTLDANESLAGPRSLASESSEEDAELSTEEQEKTSLTQTILNLFGTLTPIFSSLLENLEIPSTNTLIVFAFVFMVVANGYIWTRLVELTQKLENIQNENNAGPFAKAGLGIWRPGDLLYESQRLREFASIFDDHINSEGDLLWDWISEKARSPSASDTERDTSSTGDERSNQYRNEHFPFGASYAGPRSRRVPSTPPLYDLYGQIEDLQRLMVAAEGHAKRLVDIAEEERAYYHQRTDQLSKDVDQKMTVKEEL